ncbi:MAG: hypothetical protein HY306_05835 [Nitrosomonadales bacterium]|nr:hypothetical protein [Nitrosomonadales bacterium]
MKISHLLQEKIREQIAQVLRQPCVSIKPIACYLDRNAVFVLEPNIGILKIFYDDSADSKWTCEKAAYGLTRGIHAAIPKLLHFGRFEEGAPWLIVESKPGILWDTTRERLTANDELELCVIS